MLVIKCHDTGWYIIEERMIIIFSQAGWLYLSPKSVFIAYFISSE